jgi:hypothetical protein
MPYCIPAPFHNMPPQGDFMSTALSISYRNPAELKPNARNARTHSRKQIKQIAKSMKEFGFTNPILIDDQNQVIAGHGRLEAAKLLGLLSVPTVRLSHLTATQIRAYILADNRLAEKSGWDREILAIELQALTEMDFEVDVTGFEAPEIDIILDEAREAKHESAAPEDDFPEVRQGPCVTRLGDVWALGQHKIFCGDARSEIAYNTLLKDEKAQFVIGDPPYNVRINGFVSGNGQIQHSEFAMASGEMSTEEFTTFLTDTFSLLCAHTIDGSIHAMFMDWRHQGEMLAAGKEVYTELKNLCVWCKNQWRPRLIVPRAA